MTTRTCEMGAEKEDEKNREDSGKDTKKIFQLPFSTADPGTIMETGIWLLGI